MVEIARIKVNWTGIPSGPGYTNFYFRDFGVSGDIDQGIVDGAITKTDTFLNAWTSSINNTISFVVDSAVEILEDTTGALQRFMSGTPTATRVGTQTANYSAGVGACVSWSTNTVRNGRRIRGRTFMVPLGNNSYATDGTLDATKLAAFRAAAETFRSQTGAGDLGIWARPTGPGATDGVWVPVTASNITDKVAFLSSRRD